MKGRTAWIVMVIAAVVCVLGSIIALRTDKVLFVVLGGLAFLAGLSVFFISARLIRRQHKHI